MALVTGRFDTCAEVCIDHDKCSLCGLCVKVCKGAPLYIHEGKILVDQSRIYGCIACGHCVAVCPNDAITVEGRDLSPADTIEKPETACCANYHQLLSLMLSRRSIRNFKNKEVEREAIERIIQAATTAPMGLPPSEVEVLVLNGRDKVGEFAGDMVDYLIKNKWIFSPLMMGIYRLFMNKKEHQCLKSFLQPLVDTISNKSRQGDDWLLYKAPLALYFYTSGFSDPADSYVAATYAMIAAESLGLGSCMIGSVGPVLRYGGKAIKRKYGIPMKNQYGLMVIFGYPEFKFKKAITRKLAKVSYYKKVKQ